MNSSACPYEEATARAARVGLWTDELREHASRCRACHETALVAKWMNDTERAGGGAAVPDPELIWIQSRAKEHDHAVEKTLLPIRIVAATGCLAACAGLAVGLALQDADLMRLLRDAVASGRSVAMLLMTGTTESLSASAALIWPAMILIFALGVLFAVTFPLLSED